MPSAPRHSAPSFGWQAAAILLPVLILSALGLAGMIGDRREVDLKARDEADGLCSRFASGLEQRFDTLVTDHSAAVEAAWTGLQRRAAGGSDLPMADVLARWQRQHPRDPIETLLTLPVRRTVAGVLLDPVPTTTFPSPASWLGSLSPAAAQALAGAQDGARIQLDAATQGELWRKFALLAPEDARPYAALAAARASGQLTGDDVLSLLQSTAVSEAGIPVGVLAGLDLLGSWPADRELDPKALEGLVQVLLKSNTPLCALLVEKLNRRAAITGASGQHQSMTALRRIWELTEESRSLVRLIPAAPGWLWVTNAERVYLSRTIQDPSGQLATWFLPQPLVEGSVEEIAVDLHSAVPGYAALEVVLAGRRIPEPGAVASGMGKLPILAAIHKTTGSTVPGLQIDIVALLADSDALYATQRRRTLRTGAIVLAATAAALAGLFAAWRAFLRQRRLAEEQSNFVASVSHELRAPIAAVSLMTENLAGDHPPPAERRAEYYQLILQECRRLGSLIENVLDFSRIERGVKRYEREPTELPRLIEATLELLRHATTRRGVEIVFENHASPDLQASVDGRAIQQALINLVDNAVKHTPSSGAPVMVELARESGAALISVCDSGPGIPFEEQARIFDRFHRLGSELRRETEGIGIGLSLVKHIVEAHGGSVRLESAPGKGSRFILSLPLQAEDAAAPVTTRGRDT